MISAFLCPEARSQTSFEDRKSTRLNSSHSSHLVCRLLLEKKKGTPKQPRDGHIARIRRSAQSSAALNHLYLHPATCSHSRNASCSRNHYGLLCVQPTCCR